MFSLSIPTVNKYFNSFMEPVSGLSQYHVKRHLRHVTTTAQRHPVTKHCHTGAFNNQSLPHRVFKNQSWPTDAFEHVLISSMAHQPNSRLVQKYNMKKLPMSNFLFPSKMYYFFARYNFQTTQSPSLNLTGYLLHIFLYCSK